MSTDSKILKSWFTGIRKRARTPSLGERELAVLDILWERAPRTAQEVQEAVSGREVTLSTIQSTLERLHRKGVLAREKQARAFRYAPLIQRNELISRLLYDIADDIAGGDMASMVSGFMVFLGEERAQLANLLQDRSADEHAQADGDRTVGAPERPRSE